MSDYLKLVKLRAELIARYEQTAPEIHGDTGGLDFPASGQALWDIYDATGIRPEYLLVVLYGESGFNPAAQNAGSGASGLNQMMPSNLENIGIDPSDYLTWSASRQLSTVVKPFMQNLVNKYGRLNSGTRIEQGNMYPASLRYATNLDDAVMPSQNSPDADHGAAAYAGNAGLDTDKKGYITPRDISNFIGRNVNKSAVQNAILETYALRSEETAQDPVMGTDFGSIPAANSILNRLATGLAIAGAGFAGWTYRKEIGKIVKDTLQTTEKTGLSLAKKVGL